MNKVSYYVIGSEVFRGATKCDFLGRQILSPPKSLEIIFFKVKL